MEGDRHKVTGPQSLPGYRSLQDQNESFVKPKPPLPKMTVSTHGGYPPVLDVQPKPKAGNEIMAPLETDTD